MKLSDLIQRFLLCLALWSVPGLTLGRTIHVSPSGDDKADGSLAHPCQTIGHALTQMKAGDTCLLRAGTYREELNLDKPGITLAAYPGEEVTVSGCDVLSLAKADSYTIPQSGVVCARIKSAAKVYQVFADGRRMDLARWPDKTQSMLSLKDWEDSVVDAHGPEKTATFATLPDQAKDYWKGGYYVGMNDEKAPKRPMSTWFSTGGGIASSDGKVLHLTKLGYGVGSPYANGAGYGFIINCLGALDAPNEWYWGDGYLYLKAPAGKHAADLAIEARTRMYILNVLADDVKISGIDFKAGTVMIKGNRAAVTGCTFRYISPFVWNAASADQSESGARCNWGDYRNGSAGICILGNGLVMKDCYIAHSWFSGMVIWGNSALVENCLVEDVNWMSKRCAGINSFGDDNVIRYCTIRNMGAACLEGGNGNWLKKYALRNVWEHNLLQNVGLLGADGNACFMYVNHQDGAFPAANSEWRYNFCVHNRGPDKGSWGDMPSLYVDNNSSGYKVHHNVVIDAKVGIRYNDFLDGDRVGQSVYFYNNTFYNVARGMAYGMRPNQVPDAGVTVENNLGFDCEAFGHYDAKRKSFGPSNVVHAKETSVKDAAHLDFEPIDPQYIDAGVVIPGIKMDYAGKAPDIGAYESGTPKWTAGASVKVRDEFKDDELPAPGGVR